MRLKFWLKTGLETTGIVIGGTALYSMMMFLQSSYTTWNDVLVFLPTFFLLFGGMMMLATLIGAYKFNVPLALAFGSTRNEVLLGLQLARLIPIALTTVLLLVLTALAGEQALLPLGTMASTAVGVYLAFSAIGSVLGVVIARYGKAAGIIVALVILVCAFCGGFFAAFSEDGGVLDAILQSSKLPWLALGIGLIFYSLSMIPEHRTVWKYNVKL